MKKRIFEIKNNQEYNQFIERFERGWSKNDKPNLWIYDDKEFSKKSDFKKYLKSKMKDDQDKINTIKDNKEKIKMFETIISKSDNGFKVYKNRKLFKVYNSRFEFEKDFLDKQDIFNFGYLENSFIEYKFL